MWIVRARCAQVSGCYAVLGENSVQHSRWVISNVLDHLLFLLWTRCSHCCPQRNDLPPSDISGQQSLDVRSRPSCVVSFIYGEVVCLSIAQICAVLAAKASSTLLCLCLGVFYFWMDKSLPQCVAMFKVIGYDVY